MFTEDLEPQARCRARGYAKDSVEVEGYVRGFARRRPDVAVTTLRFANFLGPTVDTPLTSLLLAARRADGARLRPAAAVRPRATTASRCSGGATIGDHPGTFNVAGDGVLTLSQAIRRAGRPSLPAARSPLAPWVGQVLRRLGVADFSPEQIRFLTYGRVVDTSPDAATCSASTPRYTTAEAFDDFVAGRGCTARCRADVVDAVEGSVGDVLAPCDRPASRRLDADARVIPIDGERPPRRASTAGRRRRRGRRARRASGPAAAPARRCSTGADPGRGRRARAADPPAYRDEADAAATTAGRTDRSTSRRPARSRPSAGPPSGSARSPATLAFLRRRLTGDVRGRRVRLRPRAHRPGAAGRCCARSTSTTSGSRSAGSRTSRPRAARWSSPTTPAPSPLDSVMTQIALLDHHPAHRHLRMLGADLVFQTPFVGELARKTGTTLACNADAERLLGRGRAGRGLAGGLQGHRQAVLASATSCSGSAAAASCRRRCAARCRSSRARSSAPRRSTRSSATSRRWPGCSGLPYVPVTPTFPLARARSALIPLPSKWIIEFGEPIPTDGYGAGAGRRPDAGLQPHRPGARDDPAHALPAADAAPLGLLLAVERRVGPSP